MDKEKLKEELLHKYCFQCETGLYNCKCSMWKCPIIKKALEKDKDKDRGEDNARAF